MMSIYQRRVGYEAGNRLHCSIEADARDELEAGLKRRSREDNIVPQETMSANHKLQPNGQMHMLRDVF